MYFFFILFFVSLFAIIFMIGRKLVLIDTKNEHHHNATETFLSEILDFDRIKYLTIKNSKIIGHAILLSILRIYILSINFLNKKRKDIILKIKNRLNKNRKDTIMEEKREVSKYMKIISEYRHKIKKMKHRIKEEEGIE